MATRRVFLLALAGLLRPFEEPVRLPNLDHVRILRRIQPEYPELARRARIGGRVRLLIFVAAGGTVESARVTSGHPLLAPAAAKAVLRWRFEPLYLNGRPVRFIAPVEIRFTWTPKRKIPANAA